LSFGRRITILGSLKCDFEVGLLKKTLEILKQNSQTLPKSVGKMQPMKVPKKRKHVSRSERIRNVNIFNYSKVSPPLPRTGVFPQNS
jgi:hypothetical protein